VLHRTAFYLIFNCVAQPTTASYQFARLNSISLKFFSLRLAHTAFGLKNTLLCISLLCSDVELNPSPTSSTFNVYTLNILSLTNSIHYTALSCSAEAHHIDLFALTETWITLSNTYAELLESKPTGFSLLSFSRPVSP
jgi:hypothetical protein